MVHRAAPVKPSPGSHALKESPVSVTSVRGVSHSVTRLTVDVGAPFADFQARFEEAVPPMPPERLAALAARSASWDDVLAEVEALAPHGFLIYGRIPVDPLMRLAGHTTPCTEYLMGNHTIAERMFRHSPEVMLHAPLRLVLWEDAAGTARLSVDKPSALFASFGSPEVAAVGVELDTKLAALLRHLGVEVPDALV
jgi:uncharacterized protein (DUF302 family)